MCKKKVGKMKIEGRRYLQPKKNVDESIFKAWCILAIEVVIFITSFRTLYKNIDDLYKEKKYRIFLIYIYNILKLR